jgi:multicomponent Na+:H+ antiporter subunit E
MRIVALWAWCFLVWVLLTWTPQPEQLAFGAGSAAMVAVLLAPLGPVAGPWALLRPDRLRNLAVLAALAAVRMVAANLRLSRRIWSPSRPLRSGMVIARTTKSSEAALTAVGIITSLIVDNQLVDVDRAGRRLQYHAVEVPEGDPAEQINAPVERRLWSE